MCKQTPIALAVAAMLGSAAFPAAAVRTIEINNTTNAVYVTSNTKAWDDYATTCANAVQSGPVGSEDNCGTSGLVSVPKPGPDDALFFWGDLGTTDDKGAPTNSTVELKWTPSTPSASSATVQAVRMLVPKDDDGHYLQAFGPDKQLIFDDVTSGTQGPAFPDTSTYQRGGIWSTWGRTDVVGYVPQPTVLLGAASQLLVAVKIGEKQAYSGALRDDANFDFFWQNSATAAESFDTTRPFNAAPEYQAPLKPGETVSLTLYDPYGLSASADNPTAYLGDTLVQLKTVKPGITNNPFQATDPAEAGLMLLGTPDDAVVNYERSDNELTATVSLRSGAGNVTDATYRVFNQGGALSSLGDGETDSYSTASESGADVGNLTIGNNESAQTVDLALAENTLQRTLNFTTPNLDANVVTDVSSGRQTAATQTISSSSSTNKDGTIVDGGAHTQAIVLDTVGPILGLGYNGVNQGYGTDIQLGSFEVGKSFAFSVANIFGSDRTGLPSLAQLGDLTNLTVHGVGLDDDVNFSISGIETPSVFEAQGASSVLTFSAENQVTDFRVGLSFATDQGTVIGGEGSPIIFYLEGSAGVDQLSVTPGEGSAGLTFASNPNPVDPVIAAVRAGTTVTASADGNPVAITVENTGGEGSVLHGDFEALTTSGTGGTFTPDGKLEFSLGSGDTSQRTYTYQAADLSLANKAALSATATQRITDENGSDVTRTLQATTVGPVLDVQDDNGVSYIGTIALGDFDIDEAQNVNVSNIFETDGKDYGDLTDLTIRDRTIAGAALTLIGLAPSPTTPPPAIDAGAVEKLGIKAANDAESGDFEAILTFETDQNAALGLGAEGDQISYTVTGNVRVDQIAVTAADSDELKFAAVRAGTGATTSSMTGGDVAIDVGNTGDLGSTLKGKFDDLPTITAAEPVRTDGAFAQVINPLNPQVFALESTLADPDPTTRMGYSFTSGNFGLSDTTARTETTVQNITNDVSTRTGTPETRTLTATTVGPVLGVKFVKTDVFGNSTQEVVGNSMQEVLANSTEDLPYDGSVRIDLGEIDLAKAGNYTITTLAIANLFGDTTFDALLTNLTILNAGITGGDGLFAILGDDYELNPLDPLEPAQVAGAGVDLPDMRIRFGPTASAGLGEVLATLSFFTDMNRELGDTTNQISFNLFGTVINSAQAAPLPGTLALIGAGLFGMAALRRRRMLRLGH